MPAIIRPLWITALLVAALAGAPRAALAQASGSAEGRTLVLGTYRDAAESDVAAAILTEAYRRLGIRVEVRRFAGRLGEEQWAAGTVQGEVARVDGIAIRHPELRQVSIPLTYSDVIVLARDSTLRVRDWMDLRGHSTATVRGVVQLERSIGELNVRLVDTYAEVFALLGNGEVEAVVVPALTARVALRSSPVEARQAGVIASHLLYHYLHMSEEALVPQIERVLREMLMDGTVARIRETTVNALLAKAP